MNEPLRECLDSQIARRGGIDLRASDFAEGDQEHSCKRQCWRRFRSADLAAQVHSGILTASGASFGGTPEFDVPAARHGMAWSAPR
jgi:hypothetical protein